MESLNAPQHSKAELLASRAYLVVCYREDQQLPFSFLLLKGSDIAYNDLPNHYKFYLLPELQK